MKAYYFSQYGHLLLTASAQCHCFTGRRAYLSYLAFNWMGKTAFSIKIIPVAQILSDF